MSTKLQLLLLPIALLVADNQTVSRQLKFKMDQPPLDKYGKPEPVYAGLYVESMGALNERDMTVTLDMFFRLSWTDRRLAGAPGLITDIGAFDGWKPDVVFLNEMSANFHYVTAHNYASWIDEEGTVAYSTRISMKVSCPMNLAEYPMDEQLCPLRIASYSHPFHEMPLDWFPDEPIESNPGIQLPEFDLVSTDAAYCDENDGIMYSYAKTVKSMRKSKFGCLEARFSFSRRIGYHLVQTYIPTNLIVAISWVGFWIDPGAVPARITLSFTTLLTLTTLGSGIRLTLPPVSYAKAIDYWFMACMTFVFASLAEFAFCNSCIREDSKLKQRMMSRMSTASVHNNEHCRSPHIIAPNIDDISFMLDRPYKHSVGTVKPIGIGYRNFANRAKKVDWWSRILFPGVWTAFNLYYWAYYL